MKRGILAVIVVAAFSLILCLSSAQALPINPINIDFGTGNALAGGTISYAGGNSPLVGIDISIGRVAGNNTPLNSGVNLLVADTIIPPGTTGQPYTYVFGDLDFTTGNFVSYLNGIYTFGAGGSFTVDGGLVNANVYPPVFVGTTGSESNLLTGTLITATYNQNSGDLSVTSLFGGDTKTHDLLAFYGYADNQQFLFSAHMFGLPTSTNGGAFSTPASGSSDVQNVPVPEPISLILLGSGLAGAGLYRRLRKPKG